MTNIKAPDNSGLVILFDDNESNGRQPIIEEQKCKFGDSFIEARHFSGTMKLCKFMEEHLNRHPTIYYHAGLKDKDSDNGHTVLGKLEEYIRDNQLPYIRFSGAIAVGNSSGNGRDMSRSAFYSQLPDLIAEALGSQETDTTARIDEPETQDACGDKPAVIFMGATESNLYKAMQLRLCVSSEKIDDDALRPIVFVDDRPLHDIIASDYAIGSNQRYSGILITDGVTLVSSEADIPANPPALARDNYRKGFLNRIRLLPLDESDNHTISNYWGAFVIERLLSSTVRVNAAEKQIIDRDMLYMRYLQRIAAPEDSQQGMTTRANVKPMRETCNILLVDDQDDIWLPVLRALFPNARIDVIGKKRISPDDTPSPYLNEEDTAMLSGKGIDQYDVVICDLRLGGHREEDVNPAELSGMKVLDMIHKNNPTQHVIMFTSSNKAWNMRKAIADYGCLGYYIKESPMYPKKPKESAASVKELKAMVEMAKDQHWLVKCYRDKQNLVSQLENYTVSGENDPKYAEEMPEIAAQIELSFTMLRDAMSADDSSQIPYAFIALEQVFEIMKKWYTDLDEDIREQYENCWDGNLPTFKKLEAIFDDGIGENPVSEYTNRFIRARNSFIHKNKKVYEAITTDDIDIYDPQSYRRLLEEIIQLYENKFPPEES